MIAAKESNITIVKDKNQPKITKAKKGHGDGPMYINGFKNKKN